MKKVLLSSVAALAVFAAATPVFANNQGYVHTGDLDNNKPVEGKDFFVDDASKEFSNELTPAAKTVLTMLMLTQLKIKLKQLVKQLNLNWMKMVNQFQVNS